MEISIIILVSSKFLFNRCLQLHENIGLYHIVVHAKNWMPATWFSVSFLGGGWWLCSNRISKSTLSSWNRSRIEELPGNSQLNFHRLRREYITKQNLILVDVVVSFRVPRSLSAQDNFWPRENQTKRTGRKR